jgi:uncharacterized protein (DUF488 family)
MTLYSIGHSNIGIDEFIGLLKSNAIQTLADVRSRPFSRWSPHFNREALKASLAEHGIQYVYLGDRLGGRPKAAQFYLQDGRTDYETLAAAPFYLTGIVQLLEIANGRRVAMMCSEAEYKKCHRYFLITRTLVGRGVEVRHILHSGQLASTDPSEFTEE